MSARVSSSHTITLDGTSMLLKDLMVHLVSIEHHLEATGVPEPTVHLEVHRGGDDPREHDYATLTVRAESSR